MKRKFLGLLLAIGVLPTSSLRAQAPINDNFADRIRLTGASVDFSGTTAGATSEPGDPAQTRSVWWSWTAPADGYALLTAPGAAQVWENFLGDWPQLAVFAADSLQDLTWNSKIAVLDATPARYISFRVVGGQTYSLELANYSTLDENFGFHLESGPTPVILEHPQSQSIPTGGATTFTVLCPHYGTNSNVQWQHNGVDIPGAVSPSLILTNVTISAAGQYRALVNTRDAQHITTSQPATLTVTGADIQPYAWITYRPGGANNLWVGVFGQTNQHYTVYYSTNFAFQSALPVASVWPDIVPYVANGTLAPFLPQLDSNHWFLRAERAGDLRAACAASRRRIDFAKEAFKVDWRYRTGAAIYQPRVDAFLDGWDDVYRSPRCPLAGILTYNAIGTPASCDLHGSE